MEGNRDTASEVRPHASTFIFHVRFTAPCRACNILYRVRVKGYDYAALAAEAGIEGWEPPGPSPIDKR